MMRDRQRIDFDRAHMHLTDSLTRKHVCTELLCRDLRKVRIHLSSQHKRILHTLEGTSHSMSQF